jgi:hypothetical protein
MGAYIAVFPNARLKFFTLAWFMNTTYRLPAWVYLGFWFAGQIYAIRFSTADTRHIALWAHVGGFATGALIAFIFSKIGLAATYRDDSLSQAKINAEPSNRTPDTYAIQRRWLIGQLVIGGLAIAAFAMVIVVATAYREANFLKFRAAAKAGDATGMEDFADTLLVRNGPKRLSEAVALYESATTGGDRSASRKLSHILWEGKIGELDASEFIDRDRAVRLDFEAANNGDTESTLDLAFKVYDDPEHFGQYLNFAFESLLALADAKPDPSLGRSIREIGQAQLMVALSYVHGVVVGKDRQKAIYWAKQARGNGFRNAEDLILKELKES